MSDWDAARYHRVSDPQLAWGRRVLARLTPRPGERVLDVGCGTGRLTAEIASGPGIAVIGLDRSSAMLSEAAHRGQTPVAGLHTPAYVRGDGAALPFAAAFDAVFSAATFHWISRSRSSLPERLRRPEARRTVRCSGGRGRQSETTPRPDSRAHGRQTVRAVFQGVVRSVVFRRTRRETTRRLEAAGFEAIEVSLDPAPTPLADAQVFSEFISCVCVRQHVDRLPPAERGPFVTALTGQAAADDSPYTLDYWRLNIFARKGRA